MKRSRVRALACLLLAGLGSGVAAETPPGVLAARVWGLAKYHHPQLVRCAVDWDGVLIGRWARLESAASGEQLDTELLGLLASAGPMQEAAPNAQTAAWIGEAELSDRLRRQLAWLASQRPGQQCKVTPAPGTGQARFDADQAYATLTPDRARRALAALRYWNAIEYFFPYKADIGRDWAEVLAEHLPLLLDAAPGLPFSRAMRRFSAEIHDGHGFMAAPQPLLDTGAGFAPIAVRPVEGRAVVVRVGLDAAGKVQVGDELLAVDGEAVADRLRRLDVLGFGSNPISRLSEQHRELTYGQPALGWFRFARADGSEYEVALQRAFSHSAAVPTSPVWRTERLPDCQIGVVDLARLRPEDVDLALQDLASVDALLFDVRNYPQGTMWPLIDRLFAAPVTMALLTIPRLDQPGQFFPVSSMLGGGRPNGFRGRILLLQNEESISQSEFSLMGFEADGRAISFGSQTAAADGNITWVDTPGGLNLTFSGLGVLYPDGRDTQRVGIVPDVHVAATRVGLAAGRDEVLEAALDCRWIDAEVPRRRPPQGLYAAPDRDGEGIDVQRDAGGAIAVFSYHYDAEGRPEWTLSVDNDARSGTQRGFAAFSRDGTSRQRAGYVLDFHRGPYFPACAAADQAHLHPRARWQWPDAGGGESCVLPLLDGQPGPASGSYAGSGAEEGWGISLHQMGDLLAVVVYAYDAAGDPRWLIGQADWAGQGPAVFALQRVAGFCQGCPARPITLSDAGRLELRLGDLDAEVGHQLSIDADFGDGQRWQREQMPLRRLTRPGGG